MLRKGDELIPGYRLEEFLGKGQFGEVWRTTAPGGTSAALKFISLGGKQGLKEFRGIQRVKEVRHAHLMPITALWMLDGEGNILSDAALKSYDPEAGRKRATLAANLIAETSRPEWLVVGMLLARKNLLDRLEEHQAEGRPGIPVEELLRYMEESAKGIDYLNTAQHDLGEGPVSIQHCDIKPANIMLVGDSVVICDFGLARMLGDTAATATGMVGSPAYMAPECINRKPSHATDQYSLAITYVELRTGQLPFAEESYVAVIESHRTGNLELSHLPPAEREVIGKATSVKPEDRYESTRAMVEALRDAVTGGAGRRADRRRKSRLPVVMAAVAGLAVAATAASLFLPRFLPVAGNGDGPVPSPIQPPQSCTLVFDPPDAKVMIDGALRSLSEGRLVVQLSDNEAVTIKVWHSQDFEEISRTMTLEQLKNDNYTIRLGPSAQYHARRAMEHLTAGKPDEAVADYRQAIRLDLSYAFPEPVVLRHHKSPVRKLVFTSDNGWLVSAGDEDTAGLWRLAGPSPSHEPIVLSGHGPGQLIEDVAASSDSRWVVTGSQDDTAILWDLRSASPAADRLVLQGHTSDVVDVAFTANGRWVVTASVDKKVRLWKLGGDNPNDSFVVLEGHDAELKLVAASPDSHWLVTIGQDEKAIRWDLTADDPSTTAVPLAEFSYIAKVAAITPDSRWLVTGGDDGKVHLDDLDGKAAPGLLDAGADEVESLAIDSQGRRLIVGLTDGKASVWNLQDRASSEPLFILDRPKAETARVIKSVAISGDGRWALTGSWDKTAFLWNLGSKDPNQSPLKLEGHTGRVHAVAISPDGRWAATAGDGGEILLWDLDRCKLIQRASQELNLDSGAPIQASLPVPRRSRTL